MLMLMMMMMMEKRQEETKISIPQEIIFEILKELPAKSLLRFRCVSKLWCSTIDDPLFITSHRARSHTRPGGINILIGSNSLNQNHDHFFSINPEFIGPPLPLQTLRVTGFIQSVNGLVYFGNTVWNPSTREIITLPPITDYTTWVPCKYCLLGFAPSINEYKVVTIFQISVTKDFGPDYEKQIERRTQCKILTLGSTTSSSLWREIEIDSLPTQLSNFCMGRACCFNGTIYCLGRKNDIMAFDVRHEKFRFLTQPALYDGRRSLYPIQVGECLAVMDDLFENLWILNESSMHWKRESLSLMIPDFFKRTQYWERYPDGEWTEHWEILIPIGTISSSNSILLYGWRGYTSLELYYYELESKQLRRICCTDSKVFQSLPNRFGVSQVSFTKYVECLFRLKGCN
ncbi:putative F-box protein At1g32420 [Camellia sinensis]|uniref:putative F-box protein At1g32420 n=1 Tax=Camellia sinensis TaxID=4442 RepID=UPI001035D49D|nr:putative F-box protein At1g32420 [Camellia sinensis]